MIGGLQQQCCRIDAFKCCCPQVPRLCSGAVCHLLQRKAVAWAQGAGRADVTSPGEEATALRAWMEEVIVDALATAVPLLSRMSPSRASQAQGSGGLVSRWESAPHSWLDACWRFGAEAVVELSTCTRKGPGMKLGVGCTPCWVLTLLPLVQVAHGCDAHRAAGSAGSAHFARGAL